MSFERIVILDRPTVPITVEITQTDLVGLHSLQNWLKGFRRKDGEDIPGEFELVMFYRKVVEGIQKAAKVPEEAEATPELGN